MAKFQSEAERLSESITGLSQTPHTVSDGAFRQFCERLFTHFCKHTMPENGEVSVGGREALRVYHRPLTNTTPTKKCVWKPKP
jgi:hypothetical protein